jgi:hypothetical protein
MIQLKDMGLARPGLYDEVLSDYPDYVIVAHSADGTITLQPKYPEWFISMRNLLFKKGIISDIEFREELNK